MRDFSSEISAYKIVKKLNYKLGTYTAYAYRDSRESIWKLVESFYGYIMKDILPHITRLDLSNLKLEIYFDIE